MKVRNQVEPAKATSSKDAAKIGGPANVSRLDERLVEEAIREGDFFPEKVEWAIPGFIPEVEAWPRAAYERQRTTFQSGYATIRQYPRGIDHGVPADEQYPRPFLHNLDRCLPYYLFSLDARALARITLALHDPRTPKDVKKALKTHLRDILRGDRLLYEARPLSSPRPPSGVRIQPGVRRVFPNMYSDLLRRCRARPFVTVETIARVVRENLPQGHGVIDDTRWGELDNVLRLGMKPHLQAKMILVRLFRISESYARKLIYGR